MKFKKGNKAAEKGKRICANYPFCKARIPETERPNKAYCTDTCNRYAKIYRKLNNLVKNKGKNGIN